MESPQVLAVGDVLGWNPLHSMIVESEQPVGCSSQSYLSDAEICESKGVPMGLPLELG